MKRIEWIDNAKGLGILFVIIAHVINHTQTFMSASTLIYTFHMPLFFILSGFTLSEKTLSLNVKQLISKYAKTLVIPYFVYTFANMLLHTLTNNSYSLAVLKQHAYSLFFLHGWKATWFLSTLFFTLIFTIILIRHIPNKYLLFSGTCLVSLAMTHFGIYLPYIFKVFVLAIIAIPFVVFGHMMHMDKLRGIIESRFVAFISLGVIFLSAYFNGKIDFVWYQFGRSSIVWLLSGIVGSLSIFAVARYVRSSFLAKIGRNSMIIMCIHQIIMFNLHRVICKFTPNHFLRFSALMVSTIFFTLLFCPVVDRIYSTVYSKIFK